MRLAFLGSPDVAVTPLRALVAAGHDVRLTVTQPDRRRGRGAALTPSPIKAAATELGIPVSHRVDDVIDAEVEMGVVVAFGKLVKAHVLGAVDMINLHFSLLPRWRGAAPVERAILAGDATTGVCLMALDVGLDTGPVYACRSVAMDEDETAAALRSRLVTLGTELLIDRLRDGRASLGEPRPQEGEPTYAAKIDPDDLRIDWNATAPEVHRRVRVGRAWTNLNGQRLHIEWGRPVSGLGNGAMESPGGPGTLRGGVVSCGGATAYQLLRVKPQGRSAMPADAWLRGARLPVGRRLG